MIISDAQLEQHLIHLHGVWILIWSTDYFKYLNLNIDSIMMLSMLFPCSLSWLNPGKFQSVVDVVRNSHISHLPRCHCATDVDHHDITHRSIDSGASLASFHSISFALQFPLLVVPLFVAPGIFHLQCIFPIQVVTTPQTSTHLCHQIARLEHLHSVDVFSSNIVRLKNRWGRGKKKKNLCTKCST